MSTENQGTQSYDQLYQAEMDRLNAEAAAANGANAPGAATTTPTDEPATNAEPAPAPAPAAETGDPKPETLEERFARLEREHESTKKALNDTKAWASRNAAEVNRLKKQREEETRRANRPAVLDDNPGLEEAIRYATGQPATGKPAFDADAWAGTVGTALPGLDDLLEQNPALREKATAKARELGEAWNDPIVAIRELGALQIEHERTRVATAAREAAARDFEARRKQQTAMSSVPSAGASRQAPPPDQAKRYETMSSADFEKERRRVMGY